jgi:hypothetical protein
MVILNWRAVIGILCLAAASSCSQPLAPTGCADQAGDLFDVTDTVTAGGTLSYLVTSPWSANLLMRLSWSDRATSVSLRSTIVECGGHTGCLKDRRTTTDRADLEEGVEVDGWRGKTYRVDVLGDPARDQPFRLLVSYKIACES